MNWQKAKTVLLIALLITDIFLAGILLADRQRIAPEEDSEAFHRKTAEILNENGMALNAEIPADGEMLPVLDVKFESDSAQNWNRRFFKEAGEIIENQQQLVKIEAEGEILHIVDNRRLLYEAEGNSDRSLSRKEAERLAKSFLETKDFDTGDMRLVFGERRDNAWHLVYTGMYEGDYLESTYTEFDIAGDKVVKMERLWTEVLEETGEMKALPPASQSLFRLLSREDLKGRSVEKIDPCYYFNPEEQGAVENLFHGIRGNATVAWRMVLDGGEELVIF